MLSRATVGFKSYICPLLSRRIISIAVKLARLGRDIRFKDYKFGRMLMEYIQFIILKMSREQLGIRFITLDAYEDRVSYYESLQFKENAQQDKRKETVSMRLDIYTEMTMND